MTRRCAATFATASQLTTTKWPALVDLPPGVATRIFPVFAPLGTCAVICVPESTTKLAAVPPNFTLVAPPKFCPDMVTLVPTGPEDGSRGHC